MRIGCETPDYTDGPCHCAACDPDRFQEERRERYVAVIFEHFGDLPYVDVLVRRCADAVMDVADEEFSAGFKRNTKLLSEIQKHRELRQAAEAEVREQDSELTRLHAELYRVNESAKRGIDIACEHTARLRATISRVRTLCCAEEMNVIDPDKASVRTSAVRAALDGEIDV